MPVSSQSGHGMTCIHPVVVGEMHLHHQSIGVIRQVDLICVFFRLESRTGMAGCCRLGMS